jgi:hypothetical protein
MTKQKINKRKTIGALTQDRGQMPQPTRKDVVKKKLNDRKVVKRKLKSGEYED